MILKELSLRSIEKYKCDISGIVIRTFKLIVFTVSLIKSKKKKKPIYKLRNCQILLHSNDGRIINDGDIR